MQVSLEFRAEPRTKRCSKCGGVKPLSAFSRQEGGRFGRRSHCKECVKRQRIDYTRKHPEKVRAKRARWYQANRVEVLAKRAEWYQANRSVKLARDAERYWADRPERLVRMTEYRREHRAEIRAQQAASRASRHDAPGRGITGKEWEAILNSTGGLCTYCGQRREMELDHVVPLSQCGAHEPENVVPVCHPCNASKGNRPVFEWMTRQDIAA